MHNVASDKFDAIKYVVQIVYNQPYFEDALPFGLIVQVTRIDGQLQEENLYSYTSSALIDP